jgi:Na+-translocating ferredoxin:NAD+ oxidoreductase subunit E
MSDNVNTNNDSGEYIKLYFNIFSKGITVENPVFILMLGLCPVLAVSTTLTNGISMGLIVCIMLIFSNIFISITRNIIPENLSFFSNIVFIGILAALFQILLNILLPQIVKSLDIYLPLLTVSTLILGRGIFYARKNTFGKAMLDAMGMGIGFLFSIMIISFLREILGKAELNFQDFGLSNFSLNNDGKIVLELFDKKIEIFSRILVFALPAGSFFILGLITALINGLKNKKDKNV